jgi:hypothetical protein
MQPPSSFTAFVVPLDGASTPLDPIVTLTAVTSAVSTTVPASVALKPLVTSVAHVPPVVRLSQPVASRPPIVRLPVTAVGHGLRCSTSSGLLVQFVVHRSPESI